MKLAINILPFPPFILHLFPFTFLLFPFAFHLYPFAFHLFPFSLIPSPLTRKLILHSQSNNHAVNRGTGTGVDFYFNIRGLWYLPSLVQLSAYANGQVGI
jgi:hypothetical protein